VKKIIEQLQHLIQQDEYPDVIQCTQLLVSEILVQQVKFQKIQKKLMILIFL